LSTRNHGANDAVLYRSNKDIKPNYLFRKGPKRNAKQISNRTGEMGWVCVGEVKEKLESMIEKLLLNFAILSCFFCLNAQQSLDSLRLLLPIGHSNSITDVIISNDEKLIATANTIYTYWGGNMDFPSDNRVIIWNNRGIPIHRLIHESTIYDISSFSDDNSLILTMTEDAILLWDVLKGTIIEKMAISDYLKNQKKNIDKGLPKLCYENLDCNGWSQPHFIQKFNSKCSYFNNQLKLNDLLSDSESFYDFLSLHKLTKLSNLRFTGIHESSNLIVLVIDEENNEYGGRNLLIFNKKTRNINEIKNFSQPIDFLYPKLDQRKLFFESLNGLNQIDLNDFNLTRNQFPTVEFDNYKHTLWFDETIIVLDFGIPKLINKNTSKELFFQSSDFTKIGIDTSMLSFQNIDTISLSTLCTPLIEKLGSSIKVISHNQNIYDLQLPNYLIKFKIENNQLILLNFSENENNQLDDTLVSENKVNYEVITNDFNQNQININVVDDKNLLIEIPEKKVSVRIQLSGRLNTGGIIGRNSNPTQLIFDIDNKIIWVNETEFFEAFNFKGDLLFKFIPIDSTDFLFILKNNFYYVSNPKITKFFYYYKSNKDILTFEQLDPVYNRPDIVLDSIGKYFGNSDRGMITEYRKSWEKRIDRLGLDKEKLGKGEIAVPNAEIVGADNIAYENKEGKLEINISANDPKYPLRSFNVYVNEVPLYGSAGISIAHLKKQVWDTTVSVPLSIGENKIQVSVMNELGLENFKYPSYVNYTPSEPIVAKTYYIGIGVNEFKESSHNLKYCVKDVTDLAKSFGGLNTEVKLFTNVQVTKENILALKDYLSKTTVNDKVIISCSSHGLLDDSLNFYLAMHDVDFNNPKVRGLKYEELENLLDSIPARQKLLLLDACNSGENDKSELLKTELSQKEAKLNGLEVLAARGVIVQLEDENKSNFKKMNELFVNVRNNTGSVIISAAGGQESALEAILVDGKSIENGAFSYCVLEYLKNNSNKPEELTVNQLKNYVEKRVEEITNGKQKPTSRQETMEVDWGVR